MFDLLKIKIVVALFLSVYFLHFRSLFCVTVSRIEKLVFFIGRKLDVLQNGIVKKALKCLYKKPVCGLTVI